MLCCQMQAKGSHMMRRDLCLVVAISNKGVNMDSNRVDSISILNLDEVDRTLSSNGGIWLASNAVAIPTIITRRIQTVKDLGRHSSYSVIKMVGRIIERRIILTRDHKKADMIKVIVNSKNNNRKNGNNLKEKQIECSENSTMPICKTLNEHYCLVFSWGSCVSASTSSCSISSTSTSPTAPMKKEKALKTLTKNKWTCKIWWTNRGWYSNNSSRYINHTIIVKRGSEVCKSISRLIICFLYNNLYEYRLA